MDGFSFLWRTEIIVFREEKNLRDAVKSKISVPVIKLNNLKSRQQMAIQWPRCCFPSTFYCVYPKQILIVHCLE